MPNKDRLDVVPIFGLIEFMSESGKLFQWKSNYSLWEQA